jgi:hypothetical protein
VLGPSMRWAAPCLPGRSAAISPQKRPFPKSSATVCPQTGQKSSSEGRAESRVTYS